MKHHILSFLLLPFLLLSACTGTDTGEIPKSILYFEPFFNNVSNDEEYILTRPTQLCTDSDGNIYILDSGEKRIMVYAPDGTFLMQIGREGRGPGEILGNNPVLTIDRNNILYLIDDALNRVTLYSTNGDVIHSFNFRGSFIASAAVNRRGEIALVTPATNKPLVTLYNRNGEIVSTIGKTESIGNIWFPDKPTAVTTINLNQGNIAFNSGDELFLVFKSRPVFQLYSGEGVLLNEHVIESAEIDSLSELERREYESMKERVGRIPDIVIPITYFSGLNLVSDDSFLIYLPHRKLLYKINRRGEILRSYRIVNNEQQSGITEINLSTITRAPDGSLLALDSYTNATVFKLIEK